PLAGTAFVRRRGQAERPEGVNVFLAFADVDARLLGELRQAVRHAPDAVHVPDKAAGTVRPTLPEVLRSKADDLISQRAVEVDVVVDGLDLPRAVTLAAVVEQVADADAMSARDALDRAARVTLHNHAAVAVAPR